MSFELVQHLQRQLQARLIETHISWVLLDGTHAWKIKKPVKLPFLDFSELATRRRLCEQELLLNRRLAPDLYLDVCPVVGTVQAPRVGAPLPTGQPDDGSAIEYVLRMKQFEPGALLSERLAAGRLDAAQLDSLARRLAAFHQAADRAEPGSDWGSPARITQPVDGLLDGLAAHGCEAACVRLRPWLQAQAQQLHDAWLQRLAEGRVVEGHGDLHLANVVVLGDEVTAFDCIEFDPALRWIDGLNDIAFLVMDLLAHGRADLAWRFLNSYLDERGDHAGLPVLRYYLVYRAMVRALVARLRADQGGQDAGPDYLALALQLTEAPRPRLLITHGVSGSGKSVVSGQVMAQMGIAGAIRLRADVVRKRLFGLGPGAVSSAEVAGGIYGAQSTEATYARLLALAEVALRAGWPVIVDATFLQASDRARFQDLAQQLALPFHILHCTAPEAVLRERVLARHARGDDASEADLAVLEAQLARVQPLLGHERARTWVVDAARPWSAQVLAAQWLSDQVP
ncbi:MAG: AAA family ATPase [Aquabacterium sp.]|nr:AAA family ATPase [Aquabacterium sp.]